MQVEKEEQQSALAAPPLASRLASRNLWIASTVIFIPFALAFFASSAPFSIPEVEAACGQTPLDMRFFTSGDGVLSFLNACGTDGRSAYLNMQLADLFYPAVVGAFLASSLSLTLRRLRPGPSRLHRFALIPLVASAFDYVENTFAWFALTAYPDPIATNSLLGFASAAKTTTSWAGGILLLATLGALGVRALRNRRRGEPTKVQLHGARSTSAVVEASGHA